MSDDVQQQKDQIERDYQALLSEVNMTDLQETITQTATDIAALPERIKAIRDRGYARRV